MLQYCKTNSQRFITVKMKRWFTFNQFKDFQSECIKYRRQEEYPLMCYPKKEFRQLGILVHVLLPCTCSRHLSFFCQWCHVLLESFRWHRDIPLVLGNILPSIPWTCSSTHPQRLRSSLGRVLWNEIGVFKSLFQNIENIIKVPQY